MFDGVLTLMVQVVMSITYCNLTLRNSTLFVVYTVVFAWGLP